MIIYIIESALCINAMDGGGEKKVCCILTCSLFGTTFVKDGKFGIAALTTQTINT